MADFADPVAAAGQGVIQGVQIGMQARQHAWERKYQQAAFAVDLASKPGVPESVKLQALNKGLRPLLNDRRFGIASQAGDELPEFTTESLQDKGLQEVFSKMQSVGGDKDLTPGMKRNFQKQLMIDYLQKTGKSGEAVKMQEDLLKSQEEQDLQNNKQGMDLRQEFLARPEIKDFQATTTNIGKVKKLAPIGTAASDMSLIFAYMKMLDPNSVVREGEQAQAQQTTGVPGQIVNAYNRAVSGQRLTESQRKEFVGAADTIYKDAETRYGELEGQYNAQFKSVGLEPSKYMVNLRSPRLQAPTAAGAPAPTAAQPAVATQPQSADDYLKKIGLK